MIKFGRFRTPLPIPGKIELCVRVRHRFDDPNREFDKILAVGVGHKFQHFSFAFSKISNLQFFWGAVVWLVYRDVKKVVNSLCAADTTKRDHWALSHIMIHHYDSFICYDQRSHGTRESGVGQPIEVYAKNLTFAKQRSRKEAKHYDY